MRGRTVTADPAGRPPVGAEWHLHEFAASLTSSSHNTVVAYRSDIEGFVVWAERLGTADPAGVDRLVLRRYVADGLGAPAVVLM